jgi:D-arginine dehydrogenase
MSDAGADVIVIGAGIAGASAAAELSRTHRVVILEREAMPGYHSTGRSAAIFSEIYGNSVVRALSRASRSFFFAPARGFSEYPLVKARGAMHIARSDQVAALIKFATALEAPEAVTRIDGVRARSLTPVLRESYVREALFEAGASDVDVDALHQGYLRAFRANGGAVVTNAEVEGLERRDGAWHVRTRAGACAAPIIVNAAGAWADEIGYMAGARRCGIQPCRRTAILVEVPAGTAPETMPLTIDIEETFYFKPDAGLLLVSPADETAVAPCDVQPEEIDVAFAIDRLERATNLKVERIRKRWAGLRSFAPDRSPIIGFDPARPGLFWLAGQGGYGIQTAPAAAKLAAALVRGEALPQELDGFDPAAVSPARFVPQAAARVAAL